MYERIHPDAMYGKAKKTRDSGTESLRPVSYLTYAAKQFKKSKTTVWKYVCLYGNLIQGHPQEFAALKQCDHPILAKIEDLLALAQSDDIEALTRLLCGLGMTPDDRKSNPCTLKEAQKRLEQHRKDTATQIAELEHATRETTRDIAVQIRKVYEAFSPEVQAEIDKLPALKDNLTDLQDFASFDEECQRAILVDMDEQRCPYDDVAAVWKNYASQTVEDIYGRFSPELQAEIETVPALRKSKRDLFQLSDWDKEEEQRAIIGCMRDQGITYDEAEERASYNEYHEQEDEEPPVVDLDEIVRVLYAHIDTYFREQGVYETWDVKIRHERNTKGRTRMLISIQETVQSNGNAQRKTTSSQE